MKFITKVYEATDKDTSDVKGYAFQLATTEGYDGTINMMVGINADGHLMVLILSVIQRHRASEQKLMMPPLKINLFKKQRPC